MPPQQNTGQSDGQKYDFIVNPAKPPKKPLIPVLNSKASFTKRLIIIIGGAVILIIAMWIVGSVLGGSHINSNDLITLMQEQQEIARVSVQGTTDTARAGIKNASKNTQLTLTSQQQLWLQFLANQGIKVKSDQLAQLQNANTDQLLASAKSNNTFDTTYLQTMNKFLTDYAAQIKADYGKATSDSERQLLNDNYSQVQLLLEQMPDK